MTFMVISNSFKDGDCLPSDFILSPNFGFGCAGEAPKIKVDRARRLAQQGALTPNYRAESYTHSNFQSRTNSVSDQGVSYPCIFFSRI